MSTADDFLRLACLDYEQWRPAMADQARRMLLENPEIARSSIYTAAAAGDADAIRSMVTPDDVNRRGGVFDWEPLLYACYSRVGSTVEVIRVLLESGADPNAHFLWHGNLPPFTALTGAFGNGEAGVNEPPHPEWRAIARLLLDAGADPNDEQTLYNRHFLPDDEHLRILLAYGLGRGERGRQLLVEELWNGARKGYFDRVKLLVEHGADVSAAGVRDKRTPWEAAFRQGHLEIADYLAANGAKPVDLEPKERFAAAVLGMRRDEVRALLGTHPNMLEILGHHGRVELMHRAVEVRRPEAIRLMAELGFEISETTRHDSVGMNLAATPLHNAAWIGDLEMVKLLVELGANPNVRDPNHHGRPLDWAAYNQKAEVVEYLRPLTAPESR